MTIKLMSWNVAKRTKKLPQQLEKIGAAGIDILALQEVKPENVEGFKEGLREIGLNHVVTNYDLPDILNLKTGPSKNGKAVDGELIASRWPLDMKPRFFGKIPWQKSALSALVKSDDYGEIEIHAVHVPNASSSGRWEEKPDGNWNYGPPNRKRGRQIKVCTFEGIYDALSTKSKRHRVLCGDFNSPKEEHRDGTVIFFGDEDEHRESEKRVIHGLDAYDLKDTYRKLNSYETQEYSWRNRRFDHIFSSESLNPIECEYLPEFRKSGLSDHSPVYAIYKPKLL